MNYVGIDLHKTSGQGSRRGRRRCTSGGRASRSGEGRHADFSGFDFWLAKLHQFGGGLQKAEMVRAFLLSTGYRSRFGP